MLLKFNYQNASSDDKCENSNAHKIFRCSEADSVKSSEVFWYLFRSFGNLGVLQYQKQHVSCLFAGGHVSRFLSIFIIMTPNIYISAYGTLLLKHRFC